MYVDSKVVKVRRRGAGASRKGVCMCVFMCSVYARALTLTPSSRNKVVVGELVSN